MLNFIWTLKSGGRIQACRKKLRETSTQHWEIAIGRPAQLVGPEKEQICYISRDLSFPFLTCLAPGSFWQGSNVRSLLNCNQHTAVRRMQWKLSFWSNGDGTARLLELLGSGFRATRRAFQNNVHVLVCLYVVHSATNFQIKIWCLLPLSLFWQVFLFSTLLGGTCHWPNTLNQIYSTGREKKQQPTNKAKW